MFISRTAIVASLGTLVASALFQPSLQAFLIGSIFVPMPLKFLGLLSAKFASETGMVAGLVTMLAILLGLPAMQCFIFGGLASTLVFHGMIFHWTKDPELSKRL